MALALFDLDDTLLDGDSASLWFAHMVTLGLAEASMLAEEEAMMARYYAGELQMEEYMAFTLGPLAGQPVATIRDHCQHFAREQLLPRLFAEGIARIQWHRQRGDRLVVITATGEHVVRPLMQLLGIDAVIAIELEQQQGHYTGKTRGVLSFREGKVTRLNQWLESQNQTLEGSFGYSDSINDLPLLQSVTHAHVVNPSPALTTLAHAANWQVLRWQRGSQTSYE